MQICSESITRRRLHAAALRSKMFGHMISLSSLAYSAPTWQWIKPCTNCTEWKRRERSEPGCFVRGPSWLTTDWIYTVAVQNITEAPYGLITWYIHLLTWCWTVNHNRCNTARLPFSSCIKHKSGWTELEEVPAPSRSAHVSEIMKITEETSRHDISKKLLKDVWRVSSLLTGPGRGGTWRCWGC